jgi:hypothetical protein
MEAAGRTDHLRDVSGVHAEICTAVDGGVTLDQRIGVAAADLLLESLIPILQVGHM